VQTPSERGRPQRPAEDGPDGKNGLDPAVVHHPLRRHRRDQPDKPHDVPVIRSEMPIDDRLMMRDAIPKCPTSVEIRVELLPRPEISAESVTQCRQVAAAG
jgi:hypothetical protein